MDNIIKFEPQNNVLSNQEIETLFKGLIKLVEKNTEQKLKNAGVLSQEKIDTNSKAKVYNFSSAIKSINNTDLADKTVTNDSISHQKSNTDITLNSNSANCSQKPGVNDISSQLNNNTENNNNLKVIAELQNIKLRAIKVVEENKELKQKLKTLEEKLIHLRSEILSLEK